MGEIFTDSLYDYVITRYSIPSSDFENIDNIDGMEIFRRPTKLKVDIQKTCDFVYNSKEIDLFNTLKLNEMKLNPYEFQTEINWEILRKFKKWMRDYAFKTTSLEIISHFNSLIELYLTKTVVKAKDLEIVSITCFYISSKFLGKFLVEIQSLTTDPLDIDKITKKEVEIYFDIDFNLMISTPFSFLNNLYKKHKIRKDDIEFCNELSIMISIEIKELSGYLPSVLAEACLYLIFNFNYSYEIVPEVSQIIIPYYEKFRKTDYFKSDKRELNISNSIFVHNQPIIFDDTNEIRKSHKSNYKLQAVVGEGAFGKVYRTIDNKVIKKYKDRGDDGGIKYDAVREISILIKMNHPNIIRIEEIIFDNNLSIVIESFKSDLETSIFKGEAKNVRFYFYEICKGVEYLHSNGILHRDLKPSNILVDGKIVKITDFGSTRYQSGKQKDEWTQGVTTANYRAPEIFLGVKEYTSAIDIWSLGCVLLKLIKKYIAFADGMTETEIIFKIFSTFGTPELNINDYNTTRLNQFLFKTNFYPKNLSIVFEINDPATLNLLCRIFSIDYNMRINITDILKHDYLNV
jgi:cyclin-dependent kinase